MNSKYSNEFSVQGFIDRICWVIVFLSGLYVLAHLVAWYLRG